MPTLADSKLLLELRDIHPPESVAPWPPAAGWWLLGAVLAALVAVLLLRRRQGALRREANAELRRIRERFREHDEPSRLALEASMLLRRVALARHPRQTVAGLHGEAWLEFLDRHGGDGGFTKGPGRVLAEAPFRPAARFDAEELLLLIGRWLARNT
jgi:hypothetical protein